MVNLFFNEKKLHRVEHVLVTRLSAVKYLQINFRQEELSWAHSLRFNPLWQRSHAAQTPGSCQEAERKERNPGA